MRRCENVGGVGNADVSSDEIKERHVERRDNAALCVNRRPDTVAFLTTTKKSVLGFNGLIERHDVLLYIMVNVNTSRFL